MHTLKSADLATVTWSANRLNCFHGTLAKDFLKALGNMLSVVNTGQAPLPPPAHIATTLLSLSQHTQMTPELGCAKCRACGGLLHTA
jgi:hypothetical protein